MSFVRWSGGMPAIEENTTGALGSFVFTPDPGMTRNFAVVGASVPSTGEMFVAQSGDEVAVTVLWGMDHEELAQRDLNIWFTYESFASGSWEMVEETASLPFGLTDVNEAPFFSQDIRSQVLRRSETATDMIWRHDPWHVIDPDGSDEILTLSLGGADAALFELRGTELHTRDGVVLDYETDNVLQFSIIVTDGGNLFAENHMTLVITNHAEAPEDVQAAAAGEALFTNFSVDVEGDTIVFSDEDGTILSFPVAYQAEFERIALADGDLLFGAAQLAADIPAVGYYLVFEVINGLSQQSAPPMPAFGYMRSLAADVIEDGGTVRQAAERVLEASRLLDLQQPGGFFTGGFWGTDEQFIQGLYFWFFQGLPDDEGRQFWLDSLANGVDRLDVVLGFTRSTEYQAQAEEFFDMVPVTWVADLDGFRVMALYDTAFDARPDLDGYGFWKEKLETGWSLIDVARLFTQSTEFQNVLVARGHDAGAVLQQLYQNAFGRPADTEGLDFWLGVLEGGGEWADVLAGFAVSDEFAETRADYLNGSDVGFGI
jgi:hypothetical protein